MRATSSLPYRAAPVRDAPEIRQRHFEAVHRGVKSAHCDICDKDFSGPQWLKYHIKIKHEMTMTSRDFRVFNCDFCEMNFYSKSYLKKHVRTVHEMIKMFKCDTCDRSFITKLSLNYHISVTHEKKSLELNCDKCMKVFCIRGHPSSMAGPQSTPPVDQHASLLKPSAPKARRA